MRLFIVSSTVLILLVLVLRTIFRGRVSARLVYAMWGLVLLRLMIPVQIIPLPSGLQKLFSPEQKTEQSETVSESVIKMNENGEGYRYQYETDYDTGSKSGQQISEDEGFPEEYDYVAGNEYETGEKGIAGTNRSEAADPDRGVSLAVIAGIVWAVVAGLMFIVILFSNVHLYRKIRKNRTLVQGGERPFVYRTDCVSVPCLYGLIRPSVYLPEIMAECGEEEKELIVLHEKMHYRHLDFIWSAVRIVMICLYWFHPMVWIASRVSKQDAEYAADEAVTGDMEEAERIRYGKAILGVLREGQKKDKFLSMASTACSSRKELQKRIASIAKKKRNSVAAVVLLAVVVLAATACSFAGKTGGSAEPDPEKSLTENVSGSGIKGEADGGTGGERKAAVPAGKNGEEQALDEAIKGYLKDRAGMRTVTDSSTKYINMKYLNVVEAHTILEKEEKADLVTVYLMRVVYVYGIGNPDKKQSYYGIQDGEIGFCAMTFQKKDGAYECKEYWTPKKGGSEYRSSIRKKFPDSVEDDDLDDSRYQARLEVECHREALEFLKQSEAAGTEEDTKGIQKIEDEVEMVDLMMSRAGAYHYQTKYNPGFVQKLVDAYNRMELVPVTNLEENSLDLNTAVTVLFYLKDKDEAVQIIFDGNRICWLNGIPHAMVMNENYFDYKEIETFLEERMRKGTGILGKFELVDYENDCQLLNNMLAEDDNKNIIIAKFVKRSAKKRGALNGVGYYEEYNTELQTLARIKKQYLLAKDLGIAVTQKEADEYVESIKNSDMVSELQLERLCKIRHISQSEYWKYVRDWYMLTEFDYEAYMGIRNISEEELQASMDQDLESYTVKIIE